MLFLFPEELSRVLFSGCSALSKGRDKFEVKSNSPFTPTLKHV